MVFNELLTSSLSVKNLVELTRYRAEQQPDRLAYSFVVDGEKEVISLTYRELDLSARAIAVQLQTVSAKHERVLLLYPPGLDFITAFFGCLYAGTIAVPAYPPRQNQSISRLIGIMADAQAMVALTTTSLLTTIATQFTDHPDLATKQIFTTDTIANQQAELWQEPLLDPNAIAFLQYTSGSTGTPKGVMVSHGNLLHNLELIHQLFQTAPNQLGVSWLPPYHDMGLIGSILQPLYVGSSIILMSPVAFLQKPYRWLETISRYQATISGGPNFAYDLCVQKIQPEQLVGLDLSSWKVAFNGAEPVRAQTLERFVTKFEPYGFRPEAFYPCYGMAEGTLLISGGIKECYPTVCNVESAALEQNQVVLCAEQQQHSIKIVGQGRTGLGQTIAIVNPQSFKRCPDGTVGEIWVTGGSTAQGYWQKPQETQETFYACLDDTGGGSFLRTGDLGFLHNGELFVTGRLKDLIVIRGRNYYPQDIELTVQESHSALRQSCGAVFAIEVEGEERIVVAQEIERTYLRKLNADEAIAAIRQAVSQVHELSVYAVLLLKTASIPKTSSGKISRTACRNGFQTESLDIIAADILPQWDGGASESKLTVAELLAIAPTQRQQHLESYIQAKLARGLKVDLAKLHPQQPLHQLGLDSLTAIEIKHQIEVDLEVNVPVVKFLEGVTIRNLAAQILRQLTGVNSQQQGEKLPFFCIHPVMGVASVYSDLAELLGQEQPFYGLQSAGITGEGKSKDCIEDIAAEYIHGIQQVQPEGPYCLGGWSFGALVAFEMAQQLQQVGQTIVLLALIDTPAFCDNRTQNFFQMAKFLVNSILRNLGPYLDETVDHFLTAVEERQLTQQIGTQTSKPLDFLVEPGSIAKVVAHQSKLSKLFQPAARRLFQVIQANNLALLKYKPQPYPGKVTLFRTSKQTGKNPQDATLGWGDLAIGGVEIHQIPGNHLNLVLPPHVEVLAEKLKACLDRVEVQKMEVF
ncbi:MAG: AMP-binding protein [Nostoc sp.]|uniref:AMP-binding protein n=1 Tax=Nostoc sp. TaxID=1180 RepID=UPI002FFC1EC9